MRVNGRYSTPASVAIALTVLRKNGIVEFIDSHCLFDEDQRKLTPGEVALILIGATMMSNNRIPLYRIENLYRHMNISGILGKKVEPGSLNDHALGRGLDTIFKAGRPKSDEVPEFTRQWAIECEPVIDDRKLEVLTDLDSIEVLVTNLPRIPSGERMENVRDGASSESVLELYLDQYKQEHTFKLLKGKVGLNDVFFKNPERETAMMFVLGLAALIRNVIDLMFRRIPGRFTTCQDMVASWLLLRLRVVDGEIELEGPEGCEADMLDVMRRLDLDEGMIVDSIERPTV